METQLSPTRRLCTIALSVALLALCSWITIPTMVPFTLQSFGIFLVLGLLGGKDGTAAILAYLLLGLCGLPVFSGFSGGVGCFLGPTGGYLLGFLLLGLSYRLLTGLWGQGPRGAALAMALGQLLVYAMGTAWFYLSYLQGGQPATLWLVLTWCVLPFVVPDALKLALALVLRRRLMRALSPARFAELYQNREVAP